MAAQAEAYLTLPASDAAESVAGLSRQIAVVLPMPRITVDGHPMIDHAAGGRLGPARGMMIGVGVGVALWGGLLSLAWRLFH